MLKPIDLLVYRIVEGNSQDNICTLTQAQLSDAARISRRTFNYSIARLSNAGFIKVEPRRNSGQFAANCYHVQRVHKTFNSIRKEITIGLLINNITNNGYQYEVFIDNTECKKPEVIFTLGLYNMQEKFTRRKRLVLTQNNVIIRGFIIKKKIKVAADKLKLATIEPQPCNRRASSEPLSLGNVITIAGRIKQSREPPPGREPPGRLPTIAVNFRSQSEEVKHAESNAA